MKKVVDETLVAVHTHTHTHTLSIYKIASKKHTKNYTLKNKSENCFLYNEIISQKEKYNKIEIKDSS